MLIAFLSVFPRHTSFASLVVPLFVQSRSTYYSPRCASPPSAALPFPTQSGYKSYKSLPRQTFGTLQSRLQPLYFSFQTLTSATLLLTHLYFHPSLISSPLVEPHWMTCEEGRQGILIVAALASSALNWLVVGPMATSTMFERHRLERVEGKEYDEPNVSFVFMFSRTCPPRRSKIGARSRGGSSRSRRRTRLRTGYSAKELPKVDPCRNDHQSLRLHIIATSPPFLFSFASAPCFTLPRSSTPI